MHSHRRSYTAVDPRMGRDEYYEYDDVRPLSRANSRLEYREIIPLGNNTYRTTVSTQTQCDPVDLPAVSQNEQATLTQLPEEPGMGGSYRPRQHRGRPSSAMSRSSYDEEVDAHRTMVLVPYNQYYQRMQEQQQPRMQVPVEKMSHGKPSELCRKYYGHREPAAPAFKSGRLGAPWRHIKQTTGNLGNHICFVDGIVKENDLRQYPPYGYYNEPEPVQKYVYVTPRLKTAPPKRPLNQHPPRRYTRYNQRAQNGFRYWYEDKRPMYPGVAKQSIQKKMTQNCVGF